MDAASNELADLDQLSVEELKTLLRQKHAALQEQHAAIQEKHAQLVAQDALIRAYTVEIQSLKLQILKLRKMQFGNRSEKLSSEIKQLELWVTELEVAVAERSSALAEPVGLAPTARTTKPRREFPAHLPRETVTIAPPHSSCPDCGGQLKHLGEDVSEMLELEPVRFKVIRQARPKLACASCDTIEKAQECVEHRRAIVGSIFRIVTGKSGEVTGSIDCVRQYPILLTETSYFAKCFEQSHVPGR